MRPLRFHSRPPGAARGRITLWRLGAAPATATARHQALLERLCRAGATLESLAFDARGRPVLAPGAGDLSLSHSGALWLAAHAPSGPIGLDIERVRPRPGALAAALEQFPAAEAAALRALPEAARMRAFLRLWCAREAMFKAHGAGLATGFDRVRFELAPHALRLRACDPALGAMQDWQVREFVPARGYVGVLAWRGSRARVLGRDARA